MTFVEIKLLNEDQKNSIFRIWNNEYPANLVFSDVSQLDGYLESLVDPLHVLVLSEEGQILGWSVQFWRDERKWFVVIIDTNSQGIGVGSAILKTIQEANTEIFGWVIDHNRYSKLDGETYRSPIDFYVKNRFEIIHTERLELDHFSAVLIRWKQ